MEAPKPIKLNGNKEMSFNFKDEENKSSYTLSFSLESNSLIVDVSEDDSLPSIHLLCKIYFK